MSPDTQHYARLRAEGQAEKETGMERFEDGIRIEEAGEGETLLFVHADFVDGGMWKDVMDRLSGRYRVACFDKRGYGKSAPAAGPICRRRELEAVIESLGGASVHLVGCSNGGQSSLDLAIERPALVKSLTLVNSTPSGFRPEGAPPPEILEMIAAMTRGDVAAASELQIGIWFDGPGRKIEDLDEARRAARARAASMNEVLVERGTFLIADAAPADPLDPPAIGRLGEVRAPTLVVSGDLDYSENLRASALLADGISGARRLRMEGCAHVPPMEEPEAFADSLSAFIAAV
jgi:2-hydroxy-6-oxonona-2,4-dienedioate hydrolase